MSRLSWEEWLLIPWAHPTRILDLLLTRLGIQVLLLLTIATILTANSAIIALMIFSTGGSSQRTIPRLIHLSFGSLVAQAALLRLLSSTRMVHMLSTRMARHSTEIRTHGTALPISSMSTNLLEPVFHIQASEIS